MALPFHAIATLFLLLAIAAATSAQQQNLTSFTPSDSPWLPTDNRILVSPNLTFAAGFRRIATGYLFSIWIPSSSARTIVWSLNPNHPINASTPLTISPLLRLSLPDSSGRNLFPPSAANASALLLRDDGSLAFSSWTSFDSPTDTVLPGQSVPSNNISLTSGPFRLSNATTLLFNATDSYWSTNTILNLTSSGFLLMSAGQYIAADADGNDTRLRRLTLDPDGNLRIYSLSPSGNWRVVWRAVQELCTIHGVCGLGAVVRRQASSASAYCRGVALRGPARIGRVYARQL